MVIRPNPRIALDCNGNPTYLGEIFNSRLAQTGTSTAEQCQRILWLSDRGLHPRRRSADRPTTFSRPASYGCTGVPDPLASDLATLFPAAQCAHQTWPPGIFLSDPKKNETEDKFDIRFDQTISGKDNFFARFSYGNDSTFPSLTFQQCARRRQLSGRLQSTTQPRAWPPARSTRFATT